MRGKKNEENTETMMGGDWIKNKPGCKSRGVAARLTGWTSSNKTMLQHQGSTSTILQATEKSTEKISKTWNICLQL